MVANVDAVMLTVLGLFVLLLIGLAAEALYFLQYLTP
jgi:hypothetical protein